MRMKVGIRVTIQSLCLVLLVATYLPASSKDDVSSYVLTAKWKISFPSKVAAVGIAVDTNGYVYIPDWGSNKILKLDQAGKPVESWGPGGANAVKLNNAYSIAIGPGNNVYVAALNENLVQEFGANGRSIRTIRIKSGGLKDVTGVSAIAVDASGFVYLAALTPCRIVKYDRAGTYVTEWVGKDQYVADSSGIAVDASGNVYVVDQGRCCVKKFNPSGKLLASIGTRGGGAGEFQSPQGVAVGADGSVYVVDSRRRVIVQFDSAGKYRATLALPAGVRRNPRGVAVDAKGNLFVLDSGLPQFVYRYSKK